MWHLRPPAEIRAKTAAMIEEARSSPGFLIGITEDVPEDRWQGLFIEIMNGIDAGRSGARNEAGGAH